MTLLVYCARGDSEKTRLSQLYKGQCKNGNPKFARQLVSTIFDRWVDGYFTDSILIPVPRSTPLIDGALFPTKILCEVMVGKKLGNRIFPGLVRTHAIPK